MSTLKWKRVRPGWYETGNDIEGAYVISSDSPGSWEIGQWKIIPMGSSTSLEIVMVESAGSLAYAKELAKFDHQLNTQSEVSA
jgi:hypothetical protein